MKKESLELNVIYNLKIVDIILIKNTTNSQITYGGILVSPFSLS